MGAKLTKTQRALMELMTKGDGIFYSQDGEVGWLSPSRIRLEEIGISDSELQSLRDFGFIGQASDPDEEYGYRFAPPDVLTPAGRAALSRATSGE